MMGRIRTPGSRPGLSGGSSCGLESKTNEWNCGERADYTKVIELNAKDAAAYRYRGVAHEMTGQREKAIEDYRKSLALAPESKFTQAQLKRLGVGP